MKTTIFLKNRLWRQLVPREERHGMLCRACVERRLGRPLTPADFHSKGADDETDPEDQPMQEDDYGIYDLLTPEILDAIDSAILGFTSPGPRRVTTVVGYMHELSSAVIPPLHDWFYFDRIGELVDRGVLVVVAEGSDSRFHWVKASQ